MADMLSPKQKSAIERAKRNPALLPILFRKAVGVHWFSEFKLAGFIRATDVPAPKPAQKENYVSLPAWPITDYLVATSPDLLNPDNERYAGEFLEFIRAATIHARDNGYSNYRVWWQFAKIVNNVPLHMFSLEDVPLFDYWLDDPYDRGIVAEILGEQFLVRLLDGGNDTCRSIALSLLEALYKTKLVDDVLDRKKAVLRFDGWHARKLAEKLLSKVGRALGLKAVELFQNRFEHLLAESNNDRWSSLWRPAIEDHEQNHGIDDAENILLEAYRDSLLAYISEVPSEAGQHIERILQGPLETTKRIAIYAIDQRFAELGHMHAKVTTPPYFTSNFRHELWHLLHNHYLEFSDDERGRVLEVISGLIETDEKGVQVKGATAYKQGAWLSAIREYSQDAARLYGHCAEVTGGDPEHPDFSSYTTSEFVTHESPIPKDELLSLDVGQLVSQLDSYRDPEQPGQPGLEGLAAALHQAIKAEPLRFHLQLQQFSELDLAYIHEIIEAYNELWTEKTPLPWEELWGYLLEFCAQVVKQKRFWLPENARQRHSFVANRHWVVGTISRCIENGTKTDEHAFPPKYLAQAGAILLSILEKQEGEEFKQDSDAVSLAINSPRGRCIEALINLTLRSCRLADKQGGDHIEVWNHYQATYDAELGRSDIGGCEFATLVVMYLPNFLYMSKDWVTANLTRIFNQGDYQKWLCAMQGYAFVGRVFEGIYKHLKDNGHFIRVLDDGNINQRAKERTIQNIAVAYLNDIEKLEEDVALIHQLLVRAKESELSQLVWFVWTLRKDEGEKIGSKVIELWPRIIERADAKTKEGKQLLCKLCDWIGFVDEVNETNKPLILAVVPYADEDYGSHELLVNIARISERQPFEAYEIWRVLLEATQPDYPPEATQSALSNLVHQGAEGERKAKDIVSQYLIHGNAKPSEMLRNMSDGNRDS